MSEIPTFKNPPVTEFVLGGQFFPPVNLFASDFGLPSNESDWAARIVKLKTVRSLEDDWDGDGSVASGSELTDGAIALAQHLQKERRIGPPDRIVASVNGTILFEWHNDKGYYEVEVVAPTVAEARWVQNGAAEAIVSKPF